MSDFTNPYQSPEADTKIVRPLVPQGSLTEPMMKYLNEASPWLRFMGIIGFIVSGLLVLGGVISLIIMPFSASLFEAVPDAFFLSAFFGSYAPIMAVNALYLIGVGALVFFPALFTYRFGLSIRGYFQTNSEQDLEQAFKNNKSLWKFNGIMTIIGLAAVPVIIIITVIITVAVLAIG